MKQTIMYRVECNRGSKYFDSEQKAYAHFRQKAVNGYCVELWLLTVTRSPKLFSVEQKLIDYSANAIWGALC